MSNESFTEFLLKKFSTFPKDNIAVVEHPSGRSLTYNQLNTQTIAVASALHKRGFECGQYLTHFGSNILENAPIGYGVMATGGTIHFIKPSAGHDELVFHLRLVRPRFVVTTDDCASRIVSALKEASIEVNEVFVIGSVPNSCRSAKELLEDPGDANPIGKVEIKDDEDAAALLQTGGTTGMSKSVMVLHKSLKILSATKFVPGWTGESRTLAYTPFGYISSISSYAVTGYCGGTVISLSRFDACEMLCAIERHRVNGFITGPSPIHEMINSPTFGTCDAESLKWIICGGAPASKESEEVAKNRCKEISPDLAFCQLYGTTESTFCITSFTEENFNRTDKTGSCGKVRPSVTVKVVNPTDETIEMKPGERGHIVFQSPTMMKGYFKNEEATAKALKDGWYFTQDYGWIDQDGFLYVIDRID